MSFSSNWLSDQAFPGLNVPTALTLSGYDPTSGTTLRFCEPAATGWYHCNSALSTEATRGRRIPAGPRTGPASRGNFCPPSSTVHSTSPHGYPNTLFPAHLDSLDTFDPPPHSSPRLSGAGSALSWGLTGPLPFSAIWSISRGQVLFLCANQRKIPLRSKPAFQAEALLGFVKKKVLLPPKQTAPSQVLN